MFHLIGQQHELGSAWVGLGQVWGEGCEANSYHGSNSIYGNATGKAGKAGCITYQRSTLGYWAFSVARDPVMKLLDSYLKHFYACSISVPSTLEV